MLIDYVDYLYFSGSAVGEAEKARAAVVHLAPHLGSRDLRRTARALARFRKVALVHSRPPMPKVAMEAIVGWPYNAHHREEALAILMLVTYELPSELMALLVSDVVAPVPRSTDALASLAVILCPRERFAPPPPPPKRSSSATRRCWNTRVSILGRRPLGASPGAPQASGLRRGPLGCNVKVQELRARFNESTAAFGVAVCTRCGTEAPLTTSYNTFAVGPRSRAEAVGSPTHQFGDTQSRA